MKKVKWKNFLSTGNIFTEISLNKHKTTSISGENGSGKTTMLDAIVFALFGRPYRNINIPQLVNSINKKDCLVELYFDIGNTSYIVKRGLSPKIFEIHQNGKLIDQDSTSKDYQRMFEDHILRMNFKSFCQVVILGSTNYIPFMRLTAAERRSVVENLLDINVFSTMNSVLKSKVSTNKENCSLLEKNMEVLKEKVELQKNHISLLKKKQSKFLTEKRIQKEELEKTNEVLEAKIEELQTKISVLSKEISDADILQEKYNEYSSVLLSLASNHTKEEKQLKGISKLTSCPVCTQVVTDDTKTKLLNEKQQEIKKILEEKNTIEKEITNIKNKLNELNIAVKKLNNIREEYDENYVLYKSNEKLIKSIQKELDESGVENKHIEEAEDKMNTFIEQGKVILKDKEQIIDDLHYCNVASVLLKDSGIKSKIIKHYLPIMNKVINRYLSEMNFFVQFELDEEFKESIKSRNRDIFSYENFSEGEKRKIDLALLFAWRKISQVKNSLNCNLLIFDEILDGSLDDNATKLLLNILQIMDKGSNIFVISHKSKDILQDKFEHNITFNKKKNFSRVSHE